MNRKLTENWAKLHVAIIGIFYIISGLWELFMAATKGKITGSPDLYFLLSVYCTYLEKLGQTTILVGIGILIGLLFRINFVRLLAIVLAWWNLFTAPLLDIWWCIYVIMIKKFLLPHSWIELGIKAAILILITFIRLYIINMLKISKAGYVFLRKK